MKEREISKIVFATFMGGHFWVLAALMVLAVYDKETDKDRFCTKPHESAECVPANTQYTKAPVNGNKEKPELVVENTELTHWLKKQFNKNKEKPEPVAESKEEKPEPVVDKTEAERERLSVFIDKSMEIANFQKGELVRQQIKKELIRIAMKEFPKQETRELWVAVLAIESRFIPRATSNKGVIGIGQILPSSATFYGRKCDLPEIGKNDLYSIPVNLRVSACILKTKFKSVNGSPVLTLIAYNAGQWSKDIQKIDQLRNINTESANYVAKVLRLLERIRKKLK